MTLTRWKTAAVATIAAASLMAGGAVAVATGGGDNAGAESPQPRAGASSPSESVFVPITPCRVVNTATSGAGRIEPNETRAYETQGNTSSQGGAASCGIPSTASALEINMTAPSALGGGYVRVAPAGVAIPNATFMNFVDGFNASNAGTVAIAPGTGNNLQVKVFNSPTHIVIDVLGYYVKDLFAVVASNGSLVRGNGVSASTSGVGTGEYEVTFDRDIRGCSFNAVRGQTGASGQAPAGSVTVAVANGTTDTVFLQVQTDAGADQDGSFHLQVDC